MVKMFGTRTFLILSALVCQVFGEAVSAEDAAVSHKVLDIGNGLSAWVLDNIITEGQMDKINTDFYDDRLKMYTFAYQNHSNLMVGNERRATTPPWMKDLDVEEFKTSTAWQRIQPAVEAVLERPIRLEHAVHDFTNSMDPVAPSTSTHCRKDRYFLSIFLHEDWKHNSYGQVSFYSEMRNRNISDQNRLEITASVHPLPMRAVLWPSCHVALFRGPSVNHFTGIEKLTLWLNTNLTDVQEIVTETSATDMNDESMSPKFVFTNVDANRTIPYERCLTRTWYDGTKDRPIYVFDGLFTPSELRAWKRELLRTGGVHTGWDRGLQEEVDNVAWLATFDVDRFVKTAMWPRLQEVLKFVSNESEWLPYDVAINYLRPSDHTRIHPDSGIHEVEFTLLLYLSEGATPNNYGETNWVVNRKDDGVHSYIGPGGDMFESIGAVAPKFGRLAVFRNNIEHSAHPPSSSFFGGRFTFAVKVNRNRRLNIIKRLYELLERILDTSPPSYTTFHRQLQGGFHDDPEKSSLSTDKLEKFYRENVMAQISKQMNAPR